MKTLTLLSVLFITIVSCNCQKKITESTSESAKQVASNMELIYTANTRGFYQKIEVKNQEVFITNDRNTSDKGEGTKISDADWTELKGYMNALKLEQLSTYKDPTQKRFYDGAALAILKVNYNSKEYISTEFDNGFPPIEIEKLVNKITSFSKK